MQTTRTQTLPTLLYNDECGVCRRIGGWVKRSASRDATEPSLVVEPIGDDPVALRALNPHLDIWDAYATIHLLLPDSSMKLGGEAVAEVLRRLPNTRWFAWVFAIRVFGFRPFQALLDAAYAILAAVRPLFGCESCGMPNRWLRPIVALNRRALALFGGASHRRPSKHFAALPAAARVVRSA